MLRLKTQLETLDPDDPKYPLVLKLELLDNEDEISTEIGIAIEQWEMLSKLHKPDRYWKKSDYTRAMFIKNVIEECENICLQSQRLFEPEDEDSVFLVIETAKRSIEDYIHNITLDESVLNTFPEYISIVEKEFEETVYNSNFTLSVLSKLYKHLLSFCSEKDMGFIDYDTIDKEFMDDFRSYLLVNNFNNLKYADLIEEYLDKFLNWHKDKFSWV